MIIQGHCLFILVLGMWLINWNIACYCFLCFTSQYICYQKWYVFTLTQIWADVTESNKHLSPIRCQPEEFGLIRDFSVNINYYFRVNSHIMSLWAGVHILHWGLGEDVRQSERCDRMYVCVYVCLYSSVRLLIKSLFPRR